MSNDDFQKMSLVALKELAKENNIKGCSLLKKSELINKLEECGVKSKSSKIKEEKIDESKPKSESKSEQKHNAEPMEKSQTKEKTTEELKEKSDAKDVVKEDGGIPVTGALEVMADGYGFLRCENYTSGTEDVYVSHTQIRRFGLRTGDYVSGLKKRNKPEDRFMALIFIEKVNGKDPASMVRRRMFSNLTPVYPNERIKLEQEDGSVATRIVDLIAPIGKGQRGMIVSPPKAGKTTLLKSIANSITGKYPEIHLMILLIDERPEEVTDIKESITGGRVEVIYSTFDEQPEHHKRTAEMTIERAKRLVEMGEDVVILLDSITRLARANNLTVQPSGRTLSGGLDPASLYFPKKFFGAARNVREGGSLTILATALVDTGSKMDDVIFEEFKGTGNMELVLDRKLQEKRVFPAIDFAKSGTRCDNLLLTPEEQEANDVIHKALASAKKEDAAERLLDFFCTTKGNKQLVEQINNKRYI